MQRRAHAATGREAPGRATKRLRRFVSVLLVTTLGASGCAAQRASSLAASQSGVASAAECATAATEPGTDEEPSGASRLATSMLIVGAVAAAVLLGTHGGAVSPPLHLDADKARCADTSATAPCPSSSSCAHDGADPRAS